MKAFGKIKIFILSLILAACDLVYEEIPSSSNSDYILTFTNYIGNWQNIHPKVLYFEDGWSGYEFWMAYTPYPRANTNAENPCIAVSHDGISWSVPEGLANPLVFSPKDGYNSDPHLLYDGKNDRLECWWRIYQESTKKDALMRKVSSDGVNWSESEEMLPFGNPGSGRLSPAVWIENDEYRMVYSDGVNLRFIKTPVASPPLEWSMPLIVPIDWGNLHAWHHDVILDDDGNWDIVVCAFHDGGKSNENDLYYVKAKSDLSQVSTPVMILARGKGKKDFDHQSVYRPSLVRVDEEFFLYYSGISANNKRYMTLLRGPTIFSLRSLTPQEMNCD